MFQWLISVSWLSRPPVSGSARWQWRKEGFGGAIKVHYFNNRTGSSEPTTPDDRKQHSLAAGQTVKKCRNPVLPIIGCVPAVFLAKCSYPLQWIYPSATIHPPGFFTGGFDPYWTLRILRFLPESLGPSWFPEDSWGKALDVPSSVSAQDFIHFFMSVRQRHKANDCAFFRVSR